MAAMFTAVIIASLGLTQRGEGALTWVVSQEGSDVVLQTSGSLEMEYSIIRNEFKSQFSNNIGGFGGGIMPY